MFSRQRQTSGCEAVIGMTPSSHYGCTGALTANPPKTGGPKFPENRENNREFQKSEAISVLLRNSPDNHDNRTHYYMPHLGFVNFRLLWCAR
jgi:hypothetical protein